MTGIAKAIDSKIFLKNQKRISNANFQGWLCNSAVPPINLMQKLSSNNPLVHGRYIKVLSYQLFSSTLSLIISSIPNKGMGGKRFHLAFSILVAFIILKTWSLFIPVKKKKSNRRRSQLSIFNSIKEIEDKLKASGSMMIGTCLFSFCSSIRLGHSRVNLLLTNR